jgi:hypothetical protein
MRNYERSAVQAVIEVGSNYIFARRDSCRTRETVLRGAAANEGNGKEGC